jgi:hypothetical protein
VQHKDTKPMAAGQPPLALTDPEIVNIGRRISAERLTPYLLAANQHRRHALQLYQWNTAVSASLYGLLQGFEVVLRNTFDEILAGGLGRGDWYHIAPLDAEGHRNIADAQARLLRDNKVPTPGRMVAELNFGFWVSLVRSRYAQTLWDKHLHKSFLTPPKRDTFYHAIERIRKLRNRVAHHEIIIGRNLMDDYSTIYLYLNGICPDTAKWIKSESTFVAALKARPIPM